LAYQPPQHQQPQYQQPQYPPPRWPAYQQQPAPKRKSPLRWIIPVVAALGLVVVLCAAGGVLYMKERSTGNQSTSAPPGAKLPTVQRSGYPEPDDSVVDPRPLVERLDAPAVSYANVPVVPACTLLSVADLDSKNLLMLPFVIAGTFKRGYFDSKDTGPVDPGSGYVLPSSPVNTCQHSLDDKTILTIQVLQESYVNPRVFVDGLSRFEQRSPIDRVTVLRQKPTGTSSDNKHATYGLRLGKTLAIVRVAAPAGKDAEPIQQQLLPIIAKNLQTQSARPTGNPVMSYDSPAFKAKVVTACESLAPEDFKAVFGVASAPLVQEELATAVGRVNFSLNTTIQDAAEYAYVDSACRRFTGEANLTDRLALDVYVRSYESDKAPAHQMAFEKSLDGGQPSAQQIGDESYVVMNPQARGKGGVVFRKGRFHVTVSMVDPKQINNVDAAKRAQQLTPAANQIAARLPG
jgi:hypothetical protein